MGSAVTPASFVEESASHRTESVALAHLSIELGHLYMEDYQRGEAHLRDHFRQVAPWVATARQVLATALPDRTPRVSTCFLVDDYFTQFGSPAEIIPQLVAAAAESGLEIDYLMRESACAVADGVDLARLVEARIVDDPPPQTTGVRPPAKESGWLCNGERTPSQEVMAALERPASWRPPRQNAAVNHSIFMDVELWRDEPDGRLWSCPYLAAVWQLVRLGVLRDGGRRVAVPQPAPAVLPSAWSGLPAVVQLRPQAAAFSAYRTFSVLAPRFAIIEVAVRTILSQVTPDRIVAEAVVQRARGEEVTLPPELVDRIEYAFLGAGWR